MKKSQIKELRAKTEAELKKMVLSQREDLARIFVDLRSRKLKNVALVTNKKKAIATILTLLREKELGNL